MWSTPTGNNFIQGEKKPLKAVVCGAKSRAREGPGSGDSRCSECRVLSVLDLKPSHFGINDASDKTAFIVNLNGSIIWIERA